MSTIEGQRLMDSRSEVELPSSTLVFSGPVVGASPEVHVAHLMVKDGDKYHSVPIPMLTERMSEPFYCWNLLHVALQKLNEKIKST